MPMDDENGEPVHADALRANGSGDTATLLALLYDELRELAGEYLRHEPSSGAGHTLQPTALVHEAYLRLEKLEHVQWRDPMHFRIAAAGVIRRVLVDHARAKRTLKRGGKRKRITLAELSAPINDAGLDVLELDEALVRLRELAERKAQVVELRFFGGLTIDETAAALGIGTTTVEDDWAFARAWLRRELGG